MKRLRFILISMNVVNMFLIPWAIVMYIEDLFSWEEALWVGGSSLACIGSVLPTLKFMKVNVKAEPYIGLMLNIFATIAFGIVAPFILQRFWWGGFIIVDKGCLLVSTFLI